MPYWRLFYHIIWATKERLPLIQPVFANELNRVIAAKGVQLGALVHAVGGIEDHIHVAASVPPGIALSEFIGQLKGSSSHFLNHRASPGSQFAWQEDYGVMSLGNKQLANLVRYVKEQKQHHDNQTTVATLERFIQDQ